MRGRSATVLLGVILVVATAAAIIVLGTRKEEESNQFDEQGRRVGHQIILLGDEANSDDVVNRLHAQLPEASVVDVVASLGCVLVKFDPAPDEKSPSKRNDAAQGELEQALANLGVKQIGFDMAAEVHQASETVPWGVDFVLATQPHSAFTGAGVRVAIVDSGIDGDHPDLDDNIDAGTSRNHVLEASTWHDHCGHGTHVAGTVAAEQNSAQVIGVAPRATLISHRVFGDSVWNADRSRWECPKAAPFAITWALGNITAHNNAQTQYADLIHVVNMSLGQNTTQAYSTTDPAWVYYDTLITPVVNSGATVVVSAGNKGIPATWALPAALPNVITVSAAAQVSTSPYSVSQSWFSNHSPGVDIRAPGSSILSTNDTGTTSLKWGTSMAAPAVSGAVALLLEDRMQNLASTWSTNPASIAGTVSALVRAEGNCTDGSRLGNAATCPTAVAGDTDGIAEPFLNVARLVLPECNARYGEDACGNGECIGMGNCLCDGGWLHDADGECTVPVCGNVQQSCGGHGTCIAPGECVCDEGYGQSVASDVVCVPICGQIVEEVCDNTCLSPYGSDWSNDGYCDTADGGTPNCPQGSDCADCGTLTMITDPGLSADHAEVCSGHGQCAQPGQCVCEDPWLGDACGLHVAVLLAVLL